MVADITSLFPLDQILTPGDGEAYRDAIKRWADNAVKEAKYVVLPKSAQDVSKAIIFAVENDLDIAIKGGGHSCSGASSSEDLVIDLRYLNSVSVNAEKQLITVGGGAVWADVDKEAAKFNLATVGGTVDHTGVGGLTVGGGYGWLTGRYGLTIDNLVEAEVVTASGDVLICNEAKNADLFWAIRGGGSNFGVVTSFVFKGYHQVNSIWSGLVIFTPLQLEEIVAAASTWAATASEDESAMIFIACPPPGLTPTVALIPFFNGPASQAEELFRPFLNIGPVANMTHEMPYSKVNSLQNPMATHGDRKLLKAAAISSLDPVLFRHVFDKFSELTDAHPEAKGSAILFELHNYKKVIDIPTTATALATRGAWYNINFAMRWKSPELDAEIRAWTASIASYIRSEEEKRLGRSIREYSNYGLGDERVRDVFGENYDRLSELKAKYDPGAVFKKWFPITPKAAAV